VPKNKSRFKLRVNPATGRVATANGNQAQQAESGLSSRVEIFTKTRNKADPGFQAEPNGKEVGVESPDPRGG